MRGVTYSTFKHPLNDGVTTEKPVDCANVTWQWLLLVTWTKSLCLGNENTKIFFTLQVSETKFRFTVSFLCVCIHPCVYFSIFEILHIKLSILLRLSPNISWNVYSLLFFRLLTMHFLHFCLQMNYLNVWLIYELFWWYLKEVEDVLVLDRTFNMLVFF